VNKIREKIFVSTYMDSPPKTETVSARDGRPQ
jgi:hypothetical protein